MIAKNQESFNALKNEFSNSYRPFPLKSIKINCNLSREY